MARRATSPYQSRRDRTRGRLLLLVIVALGVLIGALFLLASLGGEKPQHLVEQPVATGDQAGG